MKALLVVDDEEMNRDMLNPIGQQVQQLAQLCKHLRVGPQQRGCILQRGLPISDRVDH